MKLEQTFEVQAPLDRVWAALTDPAQVAPCLPGANITDHDDDGTYHGTFEVRLGPTTAAYRGSLQFEELDVAAHRATMRATGTDKRGQGGAKALMVSTLSHDGGMTRVDVETDFTITGRLARFGRGGMIQDVSNRMLKEFSECLQATLADGGADPHAGAATPGEPTAGGATPPPDAVEGDGPTGFTPSRPPQPRSEPISGVAVMAGVMGDRLRRPEVGAALVLGLAVGWLAGRRGR